MGIIKKFKEYQLKKVNEIKNKNQALYIKKASAKFAIMNNPEIKLFPLTQAKISFEENKKLGLLDSLNRPVDKTLKLLMGKDVA